MPASIDNNAKYAGDGSMVRVMLMQESEFILQGEEATPSVNLF